MTPDQLAELRRTAAIEVADWRPLDADERDLVRRALAPPRGGTAFAPPVGPLPQPPTQPVRDPRVALYRHYDANGHLLYVGITGEPLNRTRSHAKHSPWAAFAARAEMAWHEDQRAAEVAERRAIAEERPLFNKLHAHPDRDLRVVEYLVEQGRMDLVKASL